MEEKATEKMVVSVEEARRLLGLSRGLMYQAIHAGQIPFVRFGRRILIPRARLEKLLSGEK